MHPPEITPELLQQNPVLAICLTLFSLFVFAGLIGVLFSWIFVGVSCWKGRPLLPVADWSPRPWGLADIVLTGVLLVSTQVLLTSIAVPLLGIDAEALREDERVPMPLAAVVSAGYLLTVLLMTAWIAARFQATMSELGWSLQKLPKLLLTGLLAGFATLPFVFLLSAAVSLGMNAEYEHPILDSLESEGTLQSYLLALFSAVIVAPVAEEFLFRVLIQGWLQSIPFSTPVAILLGRVQLPVPSDEPEDLSGDSSAGEVMTGLDASAVEGLEPGAENMPASCTEAVTTPPVWPSVITGILFGLAHWGYGLSFIPLIALGIVLGLLYRATKSIWPCVMVHFMLNASSMIALGIGVYIESVTGN